MASRTWSPVRVPPFVVGPVTVEWVGDRREGVPEWMSLASAGCSCYWYVSLTEPGHPVHYFDWDGWDRYPDDPQPPTQGIQHTTPTLAQWLWSWVEGRHLDWMTELPGSSNGESAVD